MKKNLPILAFTTAILIAIALFMQSPAGHKDLSGTLLFKGVQLEQVKKILIQKGNEKTTISRNDNGYRIEEKEGYRADMAKTDALLVELLKMKGTEWITSKKEKHKKFGLSDNNEEALTISLLAENRSELGGIIIGNSVKNQSNKERAYTDNSARYIRLKGKADIFLVSRVSPLQAQPVEWLAKELLQIKKEKINSIELKDVNNKNSFILKNKNNADFEPEGFDIPEGKKLKTYVLNGISNALSNLRLKDSILEEDNNVKALNFDQTYIASLKDGRKYEISTAQEKSQGDTKSFIKISASYSSDKDNQEKEKTENTSHPQEIVSRDNEKFSGWVFEVPSINNFIYKKEDLFEDE